jgi:hypothetical protein
MARQNFTSWKKRTAPTDFAQVDDVDMTPENLEVLE